MQSLVLLAGAALLFVTVVYPRVKTINKQEVLGHATVSLQILKDKAIAMASDKAKKVGEDLKTKGIDLAQTKAMEGVLLQFNKLPPEEQDIFRNQVCSVAPASPSSSPTTEPTAEPSASTESATQ